MLNASKNTFCNLPSRYQHSCGQLAEAVCMSQWCRTLCWFVMQAAKKNLLQQHESVAYGFHMMLLSSSLDAK